MAMRRQTFTQSLCFVICLFCVIGGGVRREQGYVWLYTVSSQKAGIQLHPEKSARKDSMVSNPTVTCGSHCQFKCGRQMRLKRTAQQVFRPRGQHLTLTSVCVNSEKLLNHHESRCDRTEVTGNDKAKAVVLLLPKGLVCSPT